MVVLQKGAAAFIQQLFTLMARFHAYVHNIILAKPDGSPKKRAAQIASRACCAYKAWQGCPVCGVDHDS
jgi:hypothetical protein